MSWLRWLFFPSLCLAVAFPNTAQAQPFGKRPPPKEYQAFPVEGNLALLLKAQLMEGRDAEGLKELLKKIQTDPEWKKLLNNKDLKLGGGDNLDPATRAHLEEFIKKNKENLKLDPDSSRPCSAPWRSKRKK